MYIDRIHSSLSFLQSYNLDSTAGFFSNNIEYVWTNKTFEEASHKAPRSSAKSLFDVAQSEGQSLQGVPNDVIHDTPLTAIYYGSNLLSLRALPSKVYQF